MHYNLCNAGNIFYYYFGENMDNNLSTISQLDHVDQGLRQFMLGIYNKMTVGLAVTGVTAWLAASYLTALIQSPLCDCTITTGVCTCIVIWT